MRTRDINLITDRHVLSPQELESKKRLKSIAMFFLGLYVLVLVGVLGYSLYLSNRLGILDRQIAAETGQIKSLARNEGIYLLLKQKAQALSTILGDRFPYVSVFEFFNTLSSGKGKIETMEMSDNGQLTLEVALNDLTTIDAFINTLLAQANQRFTKIELSRVDFTPEGTYVLSFLVDSLSMPTAK